MEECITKRFFRQRKSCTTARPAAESFKENTNCSHFRLDTVIKSQYKKKHRTLQIFADTCAFVFNDLVNIQKKEPDKYTEYGTEQQNYRYKHRECSHNESQKVTLFKICFLPFPHFLLFQQILKFRFIDKH